MTQTASVFLSLSIALLVGLLLSRLVKKGAAARSYGIFDIGYFDRSVSHKSCPHQSGRY